MTCTRYEKLMAVANDPSATQAEREAYRRKAEAMGRPPVTFGTAGVGLTIDPELERAASQDRWKPGKYKWKYWTYVYRGDGSAPTGCCCKAAGESSEACRVAKGNKTKCGCACHPRKPRTKKPK